MKLNLRKYGTVDIEGTTFPVKTLSLAEETSIYIKPSVKFPTKIQSLSESEKIELQSQDTSFNPKIYVATKIVDKTSSEYIQFVEEKEKYSRILDTAKYIDFNRKMEDGNPFYTQLDLKDSKNWLEICKALDEAGYSNNHAETVLLKVKSLKKDTIIERIFNLQEITDMDMEDLLTSLQEIVQVKQYEREEALQSLENSLED